LAGGNYEKNADDDCLLSGSFGDSRRLCGKSEIPKLLHSQPACAAGSARWGERARHSRDREFRAPTYLRQGAIVYKTSPEQIGFYPYDRWATDPRDFVTNAVIERLRASGTFARVQAYDGSRDVNYVLSGRLDQLDEIDYQGSVKVQVAMSAEMTSIATGATVWSNAVSEIGDVNQRDVPAVVSEMNRTMERAINKLLSPKPADVVTGPTAANRH
jgi:ABC-type uncharacterized transport system auxiliary subunit